MENFKIDIDADGIALVTFDVPGRSMNTLTSSVMKEIPELVERIKTDAPMNDADRNRFFGGSAEGYTDYPSLAGATASV